jgi:hypothetical protein
LAWGEPEFYLQVAVNPSVAPEKSSASLLHLEQIVSQRKLLSRNWQISA